MNSTRTERSGLLCVRTPALQVQRTYACMETDFANLAAQVHKKDTGCDGPLTTEGAACESSNAVVLPFVCCGCGANFGRVHIGGTNSLSTALGILLAGDSFTRWSASCQYSDQKVMDVSTFAAQQRVVRVDRLFEEYLMSRNDRLRDDPARKIRVVVEDHYILKNKEHLLQRMEGKFGLEVRLGVMRV